MIKNNYLLISPFSPGFHRIKSPKRKNSQNKIIKKSGTTIAKRQPTFAQDS